MKFEIPEAALTSPGRAISERARWENSLTAIVDQHMIDFLNRVTIDVLAAKEVNPLTIENFYIATVDDILREIEADSSILRVIEEALRDDAMPNEVFDTANYLLTESLKLGLSDDELTQIMTAGLDYDEPAITDEANVEVSLQASAVPRIIGQALARSVGRGASRRKRSKSMSRTAATASLNEAQNRHMQRTELTHKQWITRRDDKVRPTHVEADSQIVPKASLFRVGNASLSYPGQGSYPPEEVINCRCVMIAVTADGQTFSR